MWPLATTLPSSLPSISTRDHLSCNTGYLYLHSSGNSLNFGNYWRAIDAFTSLKEKSVRPVIETVPKTHKSSRIPHFFDTEVPYFWSLDKVITVAKRGNTCRFHGCKQTFKIATSKWLDAPKNMITCSCSLLAWRILCIFFPWKMSLIKKKNIVWNNNTFNTKFQSET